MKMTSDVDQRRRYLHTAMFMLGSSATILVGVSAPFLVIPMIKKFGHIPWMTTPQFVCRRAFQRIRELDPSIDAALKSKNHGP